MTDPGSGRFFDRFIRGAERIGNVLPHPFMVFVLLIMVVVGLSILLAQLGTSVSYVTIDPATGEEATNTVRVLSLAQRSIIQETMQDFVNIYATFTPVGFVIIMILGVSVAEHTGFFSAVIRTIVRRTPPALITFVIAVVGICANIASDAGIVIAPTLGGAIFLALRRHPVAGVCAGYVAAYGGFSANLLISGTDVVLAGITQSAASHFAVDAAVHPLMNWYCMMGSTVVLATAVTVVTEKVIVPYLGEYRPGDGAVGGAAPGTDSGAGSGSVGAVPEELHLGPGEKRGLWVAAAVTLLFLAVLLVFTVPQDALLRNEEGQLLPRSPLISGIIFILFAYFVVVGIAYGVAAKTLRSEKEVPKMMERGLAGVASFLVVCLPASLFIHLFQESNMTAVIAVRGADLIRNLDIGMVPTLLLFALFCAALNVVITSGFTKWLILAPIFIPLFYQLNVGPAIVQMSYRIGDSTTNIISPVSAYLPFFLGLLEKYRTKGQEVGIGTAMALMLPYSLTLLVLWILYLAAWLLLGLDPGPGVPLFLS
ncbi:MAG: AbgT family transporter [Gemmatimonadetes bacterium]|nr:AbgT family transporter [Gemmatimonadota bacterium]NNM04573.1 AbgT family transporter [Gemmatimonadota bacterium]